MQQTIFDEIDKEAKASAGNVFDQIHAESNTGSVGSTSAGSTSKSDNRTAEEKSHPWLSPDNPLYTAAEYLKSGVEGEARTGMGIVKALGYDPVNPVTGTAKNILESTSNLSQLTNPVSTAINPKQALETVKSAWQMPINLVKDWLIAGKTDVQGIKELVSPGGTTDVLHNAPAAQEAAGRGLVEAATVGGIGDTLANAGKGAILDAQDAYKTRAATTKIHAEAHPESFTPSAPAVGKGFLKAGSTQEQFDEVNQVFDAAADPLKKAAPRFLGGPSARINNVRDLTEVGDRLLPQVYEKEIIQPAARADNAVGAPVDLAPYGEQLKQQIPSTWSPEDQAKMARIIDSDFTGTISRVKLAEKLKQFNAANRANLAANNYEQAAVDALPYGHTLNMETDMIRDVLHREVANVDPTADIKASLQKYGNITDLVQRAKGKVALSPSIMELLTRHSYITGTDPNMIGRAVQTATSHWTSNDAYIKKAFEDYRGPVPKPSPPAQSSVSPGFGRKALPPAGEGPVSGTEGTFYMSDPFRGREAMRNVTQTSSAEGVGVPLQDITQREAPLFNRPQLTATTPTTPFSAASERIPTRDTGVQMPSESGSTRLIDRKALYGNTPTSQKALPAPPIRVPIMTDGVPKSVIQSMTLENAKRIPLEHGRSSNIFPAPNVQFSGEVTGNLNPELRGPGVMLPSDPAFIQDILASYDKAIKATKVKAKLTELTTQRDAIIRALRERGKK